jgi:tetratricopeptide (TPR) repeat protein
MATVPNPPTSQIQQGNTDALSRLLNSKLETKGIAAKLSVKQECLYIILKSTQRLPEKPLIDFIQKLILSLEIKVWKLIKVYSIREEEEIPDWLVSLSLEEIYRERLEKEAKDRNPVAIAKILDKKLEDFRITAKVKFNGEQLQILLSGEKVPEKSAMVSLLKSEILKLDIHEITIAKIYGKCFNEDFPEWEYVFKFNDEEEYIVNNYESNSVIVQSLNDSQITQDDHIDIEANVLASKLLSLLEDICFSPIQSRVDAEEDKTLQEAIEFFVDDLEYDLKQSVEEGTSSISRFVSCHHIQISDSTISEVFSSVDKVSFANIRLSINQLQKSTSELLALNLPENINLLSSLFSSTAHGLTDGLLGNDGYHAKEIAIGATVGHLIMPGLGGIVGSAIGGWIGGNRQQQEIESYFEYYQQCRETFLSNWQDFVGCLYDGIRQVVEKNYAIQLIPYSDLAQAIELYNQGNEIHEREDYAEEDLTTSLQFYQDAIELNPAFALAWNNQGYVLALMNKHDDAQQSFDRALKFDDQLAIVYVNKGDSFESVGEYESAIESYDVYLKAEPEDYEVLCKKSECLITTENYEEALNIAESLTLLDSNNPSGWYGKALCLVQLDKVELGLDNLKRAIELNAHSVQRQVLESKYFEHIKENKRFVELMDSSIGINYSNLKSLLSQNKWKEADHELAKIMKEIAIKISEEDCIYCSIIERFPERDLLTIDQAWLKHSDGKFGLSVQQKIFEKSEGDRNTFGESTGWRKKDAEGTYRWIDNLSFTYDFETAPKGHLPSSLWAGEDGWLENRRDRLIAIFSRLNGISENENSR